MSTIKDLRLKILDRAQQVYGERLGIGDGSKKTFKLNHLRIMPGTLKVRLDDSESDDYIALFDTGKITFALVPPEGTAITADYEFTTFCNTELQEFLDAADGSLATAAGNALLALNADQNRLTCWSRGDMKIDFDRLRKDITDVAERFLKQGQSVTPPDPEAVDWEEVK